MVVSTRHLHRRNLRDADDEGGGDDDPDEELGRSRGDEARRRRPPPSKSLTERSRSAVLDALSDEESGLARFLFVGCDAGDGGGGGTRAKKGGMRSMGSCKAGAMSLALEPLEIRNERVLMLFEAYAVFGALFLNGVWIIYEWGSWKGYGGYDTNLVAERVFEFVMAIALCCTVFLSLFGAAFWMLSIAFNSSHRDFVLGSMGALEYLVYLLLAIVLLVSLGLGLGIYSNLSPHRPETIVALCIAVAIFLGGITNYFRHQHRCCPLEIYHFPLLVRVLNPNYWLRRTRERLKDGAKARADELKRRAYHQRKRVDPNFEGRSNVDTSSVGGLLRVAAVNLGRKNSDVYHYQARLEEDWFDEVAQLKGMSVDFLSRYMPYRLAKELHKLIQQEEQQEEQQQARLSRIILACCQCSSPTASRRRSLIASARVLYFESSASCFRSQSLSTLLASSNILGSAFSRCLRRTRTSTNSLTRKALARRFAPTPTRAGSRNAGPVTCCFRLNDEAEMA